MSGSDAPWAMPSGGEATGPGLSCADPMAIGMAHAAAATRAPTVTRRERVDRDAGRVMEQLSHVAPKSPTRDGADRCACARKQTL
jgi:hypothetical protein